MQLEEDWKNFTVKSSTRPLSERKLSIDVKCNGKTAWMVLRARGPLQDRILRCPTRLQ